MTRRDYLTIGALAAVYVLWLSTWVVFEGDMPGVREYNWDQVSVAAASALAAFYASRRTPIPYRAFLVMQGIAFLLLAVSWATYEAASSQRGTGPSSLATSDVLYAASVFVLVCAWSCLALERWHRGPLSGLTTVVFALLMSGLGVVFARYYAVVYGAEFGTPAGRLDGVTAALEFGVVVAGLLCMLLRQPPVVVWLLSGTVILMAGDMAYSKDQVPPLIDPVWMLGQFVLLSAVAVMPAARHGDSNQDAVVADPRLYDGARSGLAGILTLLSLAGVLLAPLVWWLPLDPVWKSFLSVLLLVALVTIVVWFTDRFDETVAYVRDYALRVHQSRLVSSEWRDTHPPMRAALQSTGLGAYLDAFRASCGRLKQDVLFLGPERLYGPPREPARQRKPSCFIMMPFSQEWSDEVHHAVLSACETAGVRAARGDDLFTPDILEDIWQSINAADFVVADITGRNANVLYELGIAHTLAKPVLILSANAADIPIDLATRRVILYTPGPASWHDELTRRISVPIATLAGDAVRNEQPINSTAAR